MCLPVLVVLAGYSTWLRIEQYGLTPSRILAMVLVLVIFVHAVAALLAVFVSRSTWLGSLRLSNPLIALLCVVVLLAMHTPWFSPLKMSANNQVQRLLSGKTAVDNFDADTLRNRLGPGMTARRIACRKTARCPRPWDQSIPVAAQSRVDHCPHSPP